MLINCCVWNYALVETHSLQIALARIFSYLLILHRPYAVHAKYAYSPTRRHGFMLSSKTSLHCK